MFDAALLFFFLVLIPVISPLNLWDGSGLERGRSYKKVVSNVRFRALQTKSSLETSTTPLTSKRQC